MNTKLVPTPQNYKNNNNKTQKKKTLHTNLNPDPS